MNKINFKRIDHIQICVPKEGESEARFFYLGILGLEEIPKPEYLKVNGGFWAKMGDIDLHIGIEEKIHPSKRHPAFEVEDIVVAKAYCIEKGIKIKEDKPIPNFNRFSFYDPFGNRIELLGKINVK